MSLGPEMLTRLAGAEKILPPDLLTQPACRFNASRWCQLHPVDLRGPTPKQSAMATATVDPKPCATPGCALLATTLECPQCKAYVLIRAPTRSGRLISLSTATGSSNRGSFTRKSASKSRGRPTSSSFTTTPRHRWSSRITKVQQAVRRLSSFNISLLNRCISQPSTRSVRPTGRILRNGRRSGSTETTQTSLTAARRVPAIRSSRYLSGVYQSTSNSVSDPFVAIDCARV